jgi:hypothetical protein
LLGLQLCGVNNTHFVNGVGSVCDQKTSKFFVPSGRIHGRIHECKGSLLKVRDRNTKGAWQTQVESGGRAFLLQVLLKPMLTYGKRGTR